MVAAGAAVLLATAASSAPAHSVQAQREAAAPLHSSPFGSSSARRLLADGSGFGAALDISKQHGSPVGHLPSARENVELVSKLEPTRQFGQIVPEQIADLTVHEGFAYLNSWADPTCTKGGVYVVDIRNPANPQEVGFIPARPGAFHGEGSQVLSIDTPAFEGDVLAVNNEGCTDADPGGFDLYDVSDPRNPQILVQGFGDGEPVEGTLTGSTDTANHYHNIRMWAFGGKVYIVGVDNFEFHDVDIFDITNPRTPVPVAEFDLLEEFPQIADQLANGNLVLNHDDVIKIIGGRPQMLLSYWDAGYVKLDVTDPANPVYLGDTSFDGEDPLVDGIEPPEGNAHQVDFSADNGFLLAADEDFSPYRADEFSITTGPFAGTYESQVVPGGASPALLADLTMNGPTVYGGYGCDASDPIPLREDVFPDELPGFEEAIVVLQRGPTGDPQNPEEACFPGEKAANAAEAGYDAVLLVNRHLGSADLDEAFCGSGGYPPGLVIVTMCTTHEAFHHIFRAEPPQYQLPVPATGEPAIGDLGEEVEATSIFDGWGYAHLYENGSGKLRRIDSFAIEEALDERYAFGFGDLSIHEWAPDPTERLAYSSYYAGGFRVASFGPDGIEEVGKFIDRGGNNFWGVEQYTTPDGERLIGASDRDFGLYIFRYTGEGAAVAPECDDVAVSTAANTAVVVPLTCTDENDNVLTLSIASGPASGTLGSINQTQGAVTYTPNAGFSGTDSFTFRASDGAADSAAATATITVGSTGGGGGSAGACSNPMVGTGDDDVLDGTSAGDLILGRRGADRIFGRGARDCLDGEGGRDRLSGGGAADEIDGGGGRDSATGGGGSDRIDGGNGDDRLSGDRGNDRIDGDRGDDRIDAVGGEDRVFGGSGDDRIDSEDGKRDRVDCGRGFDVVDADRKDRLRDCERDGRGRDKDDDDDRGRGRDKDDDDDDRGRDRDD
jgi:hypothetical protein